MTDPSVPGGMAVWPAGVIVADGVAAAEVAPIAGLVPILGLDPASTGPGTARRLIVTSSDRPDEPGGDTLGHPGTFRVEAGLDPAWLRQVLARAHDSAALCGICLSSGTVLAGPAIERFLDPVWAHGGIGPERAGDILLALTEVVANAVLHGNLRGTPPGEASSGLLRRGVAVLAVIGGEELALCVTQEGPGASGAGARPEVLPEIAHHGGRGLFIVQALADRIAFEDQGRTVTMGFRTGPVA